MTHFWRDKIFIIWSEWGIDWCLVEISPRDHPVEIAGAIEVTAYQLLEQARAYHMSPAMASNTILARNLQTFFLLLANLAGVLAQEQSQRIAFQDQVHGLYCVFFMVTPIWSNWKYVIKETLKVVETDPTRSSSLPLFSVAPVFFSSWLSSPSLSVSSSELFQRDFCFLLFLCTDHWAAWTLGQQKIGLQGHLERNYLD